MIKIRKTRLGGMPRIAVSVSDKKSDRLTKPPLVDIVEIRVDQFKRLDSKYVKGVIAERKKIGLPIILTVRSKDEGGCKRISDELKLKIFRENLSLVDAVDIELKSPILSEVVKIARKNKKLIIISWHDLKSTPDDKALRDILDKAKKRGAHIVKIAAKANRIEDVNKLMRFTMKNRAKNLITISLGAIGSVSRLTFPGAGSLITYAYINKPSGLGQIPLKELREDLRVYYTQFSR